MKNRERRIENKVNFTLKEIKPLTINQNTMFSSKKHVVAHGAAGVGKTFIATYLGLKDIFANNKYNHLVFLRSAVPTRDMGFLPGTDKEKAEVYETPYKDICAELFERDGAYEQLKTKGVVKFMTTSFIRGSTINDAVVIVDECQNMSFHELDSVITRMGENVRLFFCGDMLQNGDLRKEISGLGQFYKILADMKEFELIEFTIEDVVRGPLVKSYLTSKYRL